MDTNNSVDSLGQLPLEVSHLLAYKHFKALLAEANQPTNEWYAGEVHGHSPTQSEKVIHFIAHGDVPAFRKRFHLENQDCIYRFQQQPQVVSA